MPGNGFGFCVPYSQLSVKSTEWQQICQSFSSICFENRTKEKDENRTKEKDEDGFKTGTTVNLLFSCFKRMSQIILQIYSLNFNVKY